MIQHDTTILPISSPHSAVSTQTLRTTYLGPHGLWIQARESGVVRIQVFVRDRQFLGDMFQNKNDI